jgi:hypothetical protein
MSISNAIAGTMDCPVCRCSSLMTIAEEQQTSHLHCWMMRCGNCGLSWWVIGSPRNNPDRKLDFYYTARHIQHGYPRPSNPEIQTERHPSISRALQD